MKEDLDRGGSIIGMKRITPEDYEAFVKEYGFVTVGNSRIKLGPISIKRLNPSDQELTDVSTTVWSFPHRGSWATHKGNYRGNWPPQMARALILKYTRPGETVLDPMVGSGTTCIEAVLLGRNCIGVDINYEASILAFHRVYWLRRFIEEQYRVNRDSLEKVAAENDITVEDMLNAETEIYHGDARNLDKMRDGSIQLVATHPPYFSIIRYGARRNPGDLSGVRRLEDYLIMLHDVLREAYRTLEPSRHMGILVGDTRKHKHYIPITHYVLQLALKTGFILREEVVKIQHNMKTTREVWSRWRKREFLLIYHEKLFILRKPGSQSEYRKYKYSSYINIEDILSGRMGRG